MALKINFFKLFLFNFIFTLQAFSLATYHQRVPPQLFPSNLALS
uniref:Uncharacterized protein n=1 Tax=Meloidogyne enterolobii TaxID=390850 RepID=A0A6V7Y3H9_MELEN|nr:unnamed protein product [Meloidogyne enterolobii]